MRLRQFTVLGCLAAVILLAGRVALGSSGKLAPSAMADNRHGQNARTVADFTRMSATVFSDSFATDPNSSGLWTLRRYSEDPTNEGSWDAQEQTFYLVRAANSKALAMFANYELTATEWKASFRYRVGGGSGADGFVFMFYKDKQAYGRPEGGSWLAFELQGNPQIPVPGYGIEFDSYNSGWEPTAHNHVAVISDRASNHSAFAEDDRLEDNQWHAAEVAFSNGQVVVSIDGGIVLSYQISDPDYSYSGVGFGAATGAYTNDHVIDDFVLRVGPSFSRRTTTSAGRPPNRVRASTNRLGT